MRRIRQVESDLVGHDLEVESALRNLQGIKEVKVDRDSATATVTFDNSRVDVPAMHDALLKSGYKPVPFTEPDL